MLESHLILLWRISLWARNLDNETAILKIKSQNFRLWYMYSGFIVFQWAGIFMDFKVEWIHEIKYSLNKGHNYILYWFRALFLNLCILEIMCFTISMKIYAHNYYWNHCFWIFPLSYKNLINQIFIFEQFNKSCEFP